MDKINKIAVFGTGKSGKAALALARQLGLEAYAVNQGEVSQWYETQGLSDLISKDFCFSQDDFCDQFLQMNEIILSPGIPLYHPALKLALSQGISIISEIEFAYRHSKHIPVIAITGTNGKTTTTTMITDALKKAGKKVFCGGNIGVPYCELPLSGEIVDYAVIEVSSFQLETIKEFHPCIGLILNIFPNHSERYDSVEAYALAKFNLLKNMDENDDLILGTENSYLEKIKAHPSPKIFFTKGDLPHEFKREFDFTHTKARGEHNEANFFVAYEVLRHLKIARLKDLFQEFINEFCGVPHRLEYILEKDGLTFYNDAKSTNSLATVTAIAAFRDDSSPLYLILGGKLRSESDKLLPELLPFKHQITKIYTIGDMTERLYQELSADFKVEKAYDVVSVLLKVKGLKGNLVFSPAFPSFDQFKNYGDRGEKFKSWVQEFF